MGIFVLEKDTVPRQMKRIYILTVLIILAGIRLGIHAQPVTAEVDSLEKRLSRQSSSADSLPILFNLFDLSSGKERLEAAHRLYHTAIAAHDSSATLEAIMYRANYGRSDTLMLTKMQKVLKRFPSTARVKELRLFIDMLALEQKIMHYSPERNTRVLAQLVEEYNSSVPKDKYEQLRLLYSICAYMSKVTDGKLMEQYVAKLCRLADETPLPTGAMRNLIYYRAAPVYTANGNAAAAIDIDRRTLNSMDSLTRAYHDFGRIHRNFDINRYNCYRRMLINQCQLSRAEKKQFVSEIYALAAKNALVREDMERNRVVDAMAAIAAGKDREAMPLLKQAVEVSDNEPYKVKLLQQLLEISGRMGDAQMQLYASTALNEELQRLLDDKVHERYRELQLAQHIEHLRAQNQDRKDHLLGSLDHKTVYIIAFLGIFALLILLLVVFLQNARMKRLAGHMQDYAARLRNERNELRKAKADLIKARDKAKHTDRLKADFINILCHEIKTPVEAVSEYSRLIVDCIPDEQGRYLDRFADIIEANTKMVLTIMNDVLDITALEHGNMTARMRPTDVRRMCTMALDSVFTGNPDELGNVKLRFDDKAGDIDIVTDPQRVIQILVNLLFNARKFTKDGSILMAYNITEDEKAVEISVTDTGIGIPESQHENVFHRFCKLDSSASGCGLGLYVSRLLADILHATLYIDASYHKGARFVLRLPFASK